MAEGREAAAEDVYLRFGRGEQILALDLMFMGASWKSLYPFVFAEMLDGVGDRPIGMEAAQLIRITRWTEQKAGVSKVQLEVGGMRNQAVALVAAALEPELFSAIAVHDGIHSLSYVLDLPVTLRQGPEFFCLDLYKDFDIDRLEALAAPVKVRTSRYVELSQK